MIVKTYLDKCNTILNNSDINTARNPITELYYGGDGTRSNYSRFLFYFDESRIKDLYSGGTFPDITKLKHTLKMTNTGSFDPSLLGKSTFSNKVRTSSFDLILFKIPDFWDEGVGYDYGSCSQSSGCNDICTSASNWIHPQTGLYWSNGDGVYSGTPSGLTITSQHFDLGNENIEMDITDAVNEILSGGSINHGFGIAFNPVYEQLVVDDAQYVGFFTRQTQTFFEPHIETSYEDHIKDDRGLFYLDKPNKLYLYVYTAGQPTNLDNTPSVTIYDSNDIIFSSYTPSDVIQVSKGVYSIDIIVPSGTYSDCMMFTDIWSGISINGLSRPNAELEFSLKDSIGYYDIGSDDLSSKTYGFSTSGIKREEQIVRGDVRKVVVSARIPYTVNQSELIDNLQYRLYVKEGKNQYSVIDFTDVERGFNNNYFLIDTASLIPNTYYIDLKLTSNYNVSTIEEVMNFDIVSRSEYKNNGTVY